MTRSVPRLMVATEFPPNATGGGPAILRQMLKGWPGDKLFWWSCLPAFDKSSSIKPALHIVSTIPSRLYPRQRMARMKAEILTRFWAPRASEQLSSAIQRLRPDAVWAIPHQWSILPLRKILPLAGVPYHVSIHDLADAHHPERTIGLKTTRRFLTAVEDLYRDAASRDTISREMALDMEQKTGRPADQILHAGVEPADFEYLEGKHGVSGAPLKIAYAGTIVAVEAFLSTVQSLARIRPRLAQGLELHLFGTHSYRSHSWFEPEWMREHGDLAAGDLLSRLRGCDWGLSPMDLTDANARYNRFSLPTKVVSYLAAGLPMICVGHSASTIARLGRRYSLGIQIEEGDLPEMDALLLRGLSQNDAWGSRRADIIRCAREEFDAEAMRRRLYQRLEMSAN